MKIKYFIGAACLACAFGWTGCSSDDDTTDTIPVAPPALSFAKDTVVVTIDKENDVKMEITDGAGDYKAFSLNTEIATVSVSGNALTVKGVTNGETNVMVSDKENQLKTFVVKTRYDNITFDRAQIDVVYRLGRKNNVDVQILTGNDGYTVTSDDEEVVTASVTDKVLKVTAQGKKEGTATLTIRDQLDREATIKVTTTLTTEPFTSEELEAIKARTTNVHRFDDYVPSPTAAILSMEKDGMYLYGWKTLMNYLRVYLAGDKSVGDKPGSKFECFQLRTILPLKELDKCRIIKNDGTKIWCVYSYVYKEVQYSGYFIQDIKP